VRRTLPTLQSIPNEVLDEMFTLVLDEFETGLILGLQRELTPMLRKMVSMCQGETQRIIVIYEQTKLLTFQAELLNECISASEKSEELEGQLGATRTRRTLEVKLGIALNPRLGNGKDSVVKEVAAEFGADASGTVSREDFVKYVLLMKVEENERHAETLLTKLFEKFAKMPGQPAEGSDEPAESMNLHMYLKSTVEPSTELIAKEEKMATAASEALEATKALQVAYAKDVARKEKETEIDSGQLVIEVEGK